MNKTIRWLLVLVALVAIAVVVILWRQRQAAPPPLPQPEPQAEAQPAPAPPPAAAAEPEIRYPIELVQRELGEETESSKDKPPLPALSESDLALMDALVALYGRETVQRFFLPNDIVRHIVATIDNLPRRQVAQRLIPVQPPGGQFLTTGKEGNIVLSPKNYARYTPYVRLAQSVNPKALVAVYGRLYPLFQEAYQELGYPTGYFNDRLVDVIDHLLDAQDAEGPVKLVQPRVLYQFADPQMEALSAGEKTLIRMGSENAAKVKATLRKVRQALTGEMLEQ